MNRLVLIVLERGLNPRSNKNHCSGKASGGFTLVEVLAAVLLLSIALLAILAANSAARETQQRAVNMSIGRNIAQGIIESLRSAGVDDVSGMTFPTQSSSLPAGNSISVSVAPYPNSSEPNLYQALVTVTWPEAAGTRRIRYETLIVRK